MPTRRPGRAVDILLIEDNPADVRLTREALKDGKVRHNLHVASDGVEALDFLYRRGARAGAPRPDIILLDLNLPRKNGRANCYVTKPVSLDPFLAVIRQIDSFWLEVVKLP